MIIVSSILLALIMAYAGRYIFSLPFVLAILPLIKTKAGISLFQILRLWGLIRVLRNSGRFNFNNFKDSCSLFGNIFYVLNIHEKIIIFVD